ncbi:hypothetical protein [Streptomyces massasporeus]|uniref:hypothetical protein n=1 Tax=Streptomyces massasporeus TaxID=67324 RepID=UPI001997FE88|nr:hypothetical protein [Streptomyces massasporeus]GGV83062.1 hypothetical protein GCM10010228_58770 [Streptomyces massasporeus]
MSQLDLGKHFSSASEQADRPQRNHWSAENLPEPIVPYTRAAIAGIQAGRVYTELGWER